jgi:hypothetical protein
MALWSFTNLNKYGNPRTRIIYKPDGEAFSHGPGFGSTCVSKFKYEYTNEIIPPTILKLDGKTYLMPLWKVVEPETTINDIEWIKPKPKVRPKPIMEINVSGSSPDISYKTKYFPDTGNYSCNCPGRWRAADRRCKHIKELEQKIKLNPQILLIENNKK